MSNPPQGILFYDPQAKPLSTAGAPQAGSYYQFYLTGTTTLANVYADGGLTTILSQTPGQAQPSTTADGNGRMNAIYLNPATTYRVKLFSSTNAQLEDNDPYVVPNSVWVSGTFSPNYTGFTGTVTGAAFYTTNGVVAFLTLETATGTSNATTFTCNNLPAIITPSSSVVGNQSQNISVNFLTDNGAVTAGAVGLGNTSTLIFYKGVSTGGNNWTASSTKGIGANISFSYML